MSTAPALARIVLLLDGRPDVVGDVPAGAPLALPR